MSPDAAATPPALADLATENLQRFATGFFHAAGPALTTALNHPLTVSVEAVVSTTMREFLEEVEAPWAFVDMTYQRGMTGTHWLIASRQGALALARGAGAEVRAPAARDT